MSFFTPLHGSHETEVRRGQRASDFFFLCLEVDLPVRQWGLPLALLLLELVPSVCGMRSRENGARDGAT
jgi:hypothetical protein